MKSTAALLTGSAMIAVGIFAAGVVTSSAEAASPATVTINYLSAGQCGSVSGTKSASVYGSSSGLTSTNVRSCTATFRVVR